MGRLPREEEELIGGDNAAVDDDGGEHHQGLGLAFLDWGSPAEKDKIMENEGKRRHECC